MCPITPVSHLNLVAIAIIHRTYDSAHDYMCTPASNVSSIKTEPTEIMPQEVTLK